MVRWQLFLLVVSFAIVSTFDLEEWEVSTEKKKPKKSVKIPEWTYGKDKEGVWPKVCKEPDQSPINLPARKNIKSRKTGVIVEWDEDITLEGSNFFSRWLQWKPEKPRKNAGHIRIGRRKYYLRKITVHRKSEHAISGSHYPMELQFYHTTSLNKKKAKIAIVSILATTKDKGDLSTAQKSFWDSLQRNFKFSSSQAKEKDDRDKKKPRKLNLKAFAKSMENSGSFKKYYSYRGSLTHPPCRTGVRWIVLDTILPLDTQFRLFMDDGKNKDTRNNFRSLQKTGKRLVWTSDVNPYKKALMEKRKKRKEAKKKPSKPKAAPKNKKDTEKKPAPAEGGKNPSPEKDNPADKDEDLKTKDDEDAEKDDPADKEGDEDSKNKNDKKRENEQRKKDDDLENGDKDDAADKEGDEDSKNKIDKKGENEQRKKDDDMENADKEDKAEDSEKKDKESDKKNERKDTGKDKIDEQLKDAEKEDDDYYLPDDKEDTHCDHFSEKGCSDVKKRCEVKSGKCVKRESSEASVEVATSTDDKLEQRIQTMPHMPTDDQIQKQMDAESKAAKKKRSEPAFDGDYIQDDSFDDDSPTGSRDDSSAPDSSSESFQDDDLALPNDDLALPNDDFFEIQASPFQQTRSIVYLCAAFVLCFIVSAWYIMQQRNIEGTNYHIIEEMHEI